METVHKVKAGQVFHSLSIAETETNRQFVCGSVEWMRCTAELQMGGLNTEQLI